MAGAGTAELKGQILRDLQTIPVVIEREIELIGRELPLAKAGGRVPNSFGVTYAALGRGQAAALQMFVSPLERNTNVPLFLHARAKLSVLKGRGADRSRCR